MAEEIKEGPPAYIYDLAANYFTDNPEWLLRERGYGDKELKRVADLLKPHKMSIGMNTPAELKKPPKSEQTQPDDSK